MNSVTWSINYRKHDLPVEQDEFKFTALKSNSCYDV